MYLSPSETGFDLAALRQGDILGGLPYPRLELAEIAVLGSVLPRIAPNGVPDIKASPHTQRNEQDWVKAIVPIRFGFCAVLSNCCDLEPRHGKGPFAVMVARLQPIGALRDRPDNFASLKANKDPRDRDDPGYIDYFYLESHAALEGRDWLVPYGRAITLPIADLNLMLERKLLQLDDRARVKFKIKLGFSLMRQNTAELEAGLENPWA